MQPDRVNPYESPQSVAQANPTTELRVPRNIVYTKSTLAEGRKQLIRVLLLHLSLFALDIGLFWYWQFIQAALIFWFLLILVSFVISLLIVARQFRLRGMFLCELTDSNLQCECPDPWVIRSFHIHLENIDSVVYVNDSEGITCHVHTYLDETIRIPGEYDNPVEQFGEELSYRFGNGLLGHVGQSEDD